MPETVRVRKWERWVDVALTFSAGNAASMDAAATATGVIDQGVAGAEHVELCAAWTYGAGPAAPPTANVYRSSDGGTTYETEPWYEDLGDTATPVALDAAVTMWRIPASDVLQVVLTNETGEAITDVSLAWRAVR